MSTPSRSSSASISPPLHRPPRNSTAVTSSSPAPWLNFSIDRAIYPTKRSVAAAARERRRITCLCSPSSHPGSFRCALHRHRVTGGGHSPYSNRSNAVRRSAMANSLVQIGAAGDGDLVRRALAILIRAPPRQKRRKAAFNPRPSRLSVVS